MEFDRYPTSFIRNLSIFNWLGMPIIYRILWKQKIHPLRTWVIIKLIIKEGGTSCNKKTNGNWHKLTHSNTATGSNKSSRFPKRNPGMNQLGHLVNNAVACRIAFPASRYNSHWIKARRLQSRNQVLIKLTQKNWYSNEFGTRCCLQLVITFPLIIQ